MAFVLYIYLSKKPLSINFQSATDLQKVTEIDESLF